MTSRIQIFCCLVLLCGTTVCESAIVRVKRHARIESSLLKLGDVADVFADDEETEAELKALTIGPAPLPGASQVYRLNEITDRLRLKSVNLAGIEFQGVATVLVERRAAPVGPAPHQVVQKSVRNEVIRPVGAAPVERASLSRQATITKPHQIPTADLRLAESVVESTVRSYLNESAPEWGQPRINALLTMATVPALLAGRNGNVEILSARVVQGSEDTFSLTLGVPTSEGPVAMVPVRVQIVRRPKIVVSRRMLDRNQIIRESDLEWLEVDDVGTAVTDAKDLIGMQTKRVIRPQTAIQGDVVQKPLAVKRDTDVLVTLRAAELKIERRYKAKTSGAVGDVIDVETLDSKHRETISVVVTAPGQAVRETGDDDSTKVAAQFLQN
jgi:flagellar basal body P-ring formation protein FlgA